ncbi:MAG: DUF2339 domain-containing protein, partial [Rhodospirillaceae bacterium]
IGGFVTPALLPSTDPSATTLFLYLSIVFVGLMLFIKQQNWWALSVPAVLGAFAWVALWLNSHFAASDVLWLGIFLVVITETIAFCVRTSFANATKSLDDLPKPAVLLIVVGLSGALMLMAAITAKANYGLLGWAFFGLLSVSGIGLAHRAEKLYGFLPWLSLALAATLLLSWAPADTTLYALIVAGSALLFVGSGAVLMVRSSTPMLWAGLSSCGGFGFFLIAYVKLTDMGSVEPTAWVWGTLSLALTAVAIGAIHLLRTRLQSLPENARMQSLFAVLAVASLSSGLAMELDGDVLALAIAAEMLVLSVLQRRLSIQALRPTCLALAGVFAVLMMPHIMEVFMVMMASGGADMTTSAGDIPLVTMPLLYLGLPALCFFGTSFALRQSEDGLDVRCLEYAAVGLLAAMGYAVLRHAFHDTADILIAPASFTERGVLTNLAFAFGVFCLALGRRIGRQALLVCGMAFSAVALGRIAGLDLFIHNPLIFDQKIEGWPVLNSLVLTFGLPVLWAALTRHQLLQLDQRYGQWQDRLTQCLGLVTVPLLFVLTTMLVRQLFHGAYLNGPTMTELEIYSYSVAWLLLGLGMLVFGVARQDKLLRTASLGLLILTVGKVFLYDAAALEGLYRVFSFLGLGLCLLGLSWFYTRYVFGERKLRLTSR